MKTPNLRNHPWRISYSSNENNPVADFYIPALESAIQYDRKSGFFSSAILSKVARGLGAMLHNQGRMRLIMGCQFSPEDLQAIQQGYQLKDTLNTRLNTDLKEPGNLTELKHFEILSWLIANDYLDIRIAIPLKPNGIPEESTLQLDHHHIFHEKVGIFTDRNGDQLAFSGSNNESISGWENNIESFHVYCAWEGGRELERVQEEIFRFEQLWYDLAPNVRIFEVPEAVQKKLLHYAPKSKPIWHREDELMGVQASHSLGKDSDILEPSKQDARSTEIQWESPEIQAEIQAFSQLANLHQHPGCLDFCLKSIPISPWIHQIKILHRVAQKFPQSFLIADEVGLGKTIETGLILRYLLIAKKIKRVLILVPASVQSQWQEELREKFNLHFWSYTQGEFIQANKLNKQNKFTSNQPDIFTSSEQDTRTPNKETSSIKNINNPWNQKNLILASSHLVRRKERMEELLESAPWDLVILDEAHHARRSSPQNRKETPNRLLQLLQQLKNQTKSLILLSATPMQIDPIEVFDLLNLLGLQGHWSYGDNFCNYFASLSNQPDSKNFDFLQIMSVDYFKNGGKNCPKLHELLKKTDRLLAYRIRDIWQDGQKIVNPKQYIENQTFINTSRQYLSVNTPLKDLMFRHTRDTLRQYYQRGLLDRDIPTREVQDNAITLEADREIPLYVAVSDYVRHFYRLAQKENRKALGFLMTLYRKRLTSSFYAIKESLQRRLDSLIAGSGSSLTSDDFSDIDDAEDPVIEGLESYLEPIDPQEFQYLENLLHQFETTGEDTKLSHFITILRRELIERESVIAFTQYTDTMDYLRNSLQQMYGSQVACYSGRGGELYLLDKWTLVAKEDIKRRFRDGEIKILLCTESASEGLNLQTCGVLINYDMPWNPMRVEQRIGRIDRIGQIYSTVKIHNFYYDGTVEAKVYRKLRERINAFTSVVGNLQPILAQVPTFIEQAVMSADPEEEDVLMSEFETVLNTPPLRPALDEMVKMDLEEICQPIPTTLFTPETIEQLFTNSTLLKGTKAIFEREGDCVWRLLYQDLSYKVTFYPEVFDTSPSLRLMSFGEPLFEELLTLSPVKLGL